jgi:exodeoxyribonuclease V alpha subunit
MSGFAFQPLRAEALAPAWRAIDRAVYRFVVAHGGSSLLAEVAAWCSLADGHGHTALALRGGSERFGLRAFSDDEIAALVREPLVGDGHTPRAFVLCGERFYLWRNFANEQAVAAALAKRLGPAGAAAADTAPTSAPLPEVTSGLAAAQVLAVQRALAQRLLVLTGGPGTGKTTTVLRILLALVLDGGAAPRSIAIAAPTGKAAQRLEQALRSGIERLRQADDPATRRALAALPALHAQTLHRLLGHRPGERSFRAGPGQPLDADVVVVDEASMLDLHLLRVLVQSLRANARLILLGDPDQLTPVEAGSALMDLVAALAAGAAPQWVRLDHVFRAGASLQAVAAAVRDGDPSGFERACADAGQQVERIVVADPERLRQQLLRWTRALATTLRDLVERGAGAGGAARALQALGARQLLCALREGDYGASTIARRIEHQLKIELGVPGDSEWFAGRCVIVGTNDYSHGLYNGDVGIALADDDGQLRVWFECRDEHGAPTTRGFAPESLSALEGAWALTVHKSQGSEYGEVAVLLPPDPESRVLSRQLLYTAVSRARERVELWATTPALEAALARPVTRDSGLIDAITAAASGAAPS